MNSYDIESDTTTTNQTKFSITSEFFMTVLSQNEKISYAIALLIMYEYSSFDIGNYYSYVLDLA